MELFKPKWMNPNNEKAENAIRKIHNQKRLKKIIDWAMQYGKDGRAAAAIENFTDTDLLRTIACKYRYEKATNAAWNKLSAEEDLLYVALHANTHLAVASYHKLTKETWAKTVALQAKNTEVRSEAVAFLSDEQVLAQIVANDDSALVRTMAFEKIHDPKVIAKAAATNSFDSIRKKALALVQDQTLIGQIAQTDSSAEIRKAAIDKLTDEELLYTVALHDDNAGNRLAAVHKIEDQEKLSILAVSDPAWNIRKAAAKKLSNSELRISIMLADENRDTQIAGIRQLAGDDERLYDFVKNGSGLLIREEALKKILKNHGDLLRALNGCTDIHLIRMILRAMRESELLAVMTCGESGYEGSVLPAYEELISRREPNMETLAHIFEKTSDAGLKETAGILLEKKKFLARLEDSPKGKQLLAAWAVRDIEEIQQMEPVDTDNVKVLLYLMQEIGVSFFDIWYGKGSYMMTPDGEKIQKALKTLYLRDKSLKALLDGRVKRIKNPHVDIGSPSCHKDSSANSFEFYG